LISGGVRHKKPIFVSCQKSTLAFTKVGRSNGHLILGQGKSSEFSPAHSRPIILVPAIEVLTTGITSANSASKVLQETHAVRESM